MKTGGAERRAVGALDKRWGRPGAPRSAILGTPVLLSGAKGPTGIGAVTPPIPRGKVAPPFAGTLVAPSLSGGVSFVPGADVSSRPARRVAPVCRRGRKPTSRKAGGCYPPDLRSPSPSAGPWGSALLRRALRRSRTRPRRSPGRASSQLHAWGIARAPSRFQEASRDGGAVLHRRRRRLSTPPQTAPEASPLG